MNPENEEKIYFYTEDLQVGYGGKQILNPVRIGIKKGEILTLVGPNGAGKSTILKSVAAQLPPLGGAVYLDGADLLGMKGTERARRMAVMFTEKVHAEWMTCRDVVAAGRYPYTGRFGVLSEEDWKAVDEAMEAVQVSELRERDFQTLSDGQRQRVMLARALCQEPELLLLDEPTSYLDIRYKLEFMSVLQELARRKKVAVILSIHELDLAERVSDWVLCVSPGQNIFPSFSRSRKGASVRQAAVWSFRVRRGHQRCLCWQEEEAGALSSGSFRELEPRLRQGSYRKPT